MKKLGVCLLSGTMLVSSMGMVSAATNSTIAGQDRFETAAKIAKAQGNYDTVILVNGYSLVDGLSASSLSKKYNAPILLVKEGSIPSATMNKLNGVKHAFLVGGENVISEDVASKLKSKGIAVERLAGSDRVKTSLAVAKEVGNYDKAFVVNGYTGEADAMSVAPIASRDGAPIIITNGKTAPTLRDSSVDYYAVGGNAVISTGLANYYHAMRLAGSNRYATNKVVLDRFYSGTDKVFVANGETLVDALTVAPLAKYNGVVLTNRNSDKSALKGRDIVAVGGNVYTQESKPEPKPEENQKPGENPNDSNTPGIDPNKPEDGQKPEEGNKPVPNPGDGDNNKPAPTPKPEEDNNKPAPNPGDGDNNKPAPQPEPQKPEVTVNDIMKPEVQNAARAEFYRLLDAHRAKEGKTVAHHKWQLEESTTMKSKHMADTGDFSHDYQPNYPHFMGGAECIASFSIKAEKADAALGRQIGAKAFDMWLHSDGHNEILLGEADDEWNNRTTIDGFGFYPRKGYSSWRIYATYHQADSASVK